MRDVRRRHRVVIDDDHLDPERRRRCDRVEIVGAAVAGHDQLAARGARSPPPPSS